MKFDPKKLNALSVRLHGEQIGVITRLAGDRQLFAFEQDYIDNAQRPTLSLSFKGSTGGLVTSVRPVPRRVPPFFSNLLPEGHLREYLAKRAGGMGGSWIVKLPSARFAAVPENEFAMLELARRAGITVPENRLITTADIKGLPDEARAPGTKALAVRRFDRLAGGEPVHME